MTEFQPGIFVNQLGEVFYGNQPAKVSKKPCGYLQLSRATVPRTIHKIVAFVFIPNPNGYKCVNHIDGNKLNNRVDNLEWCDHSHNASHAFSLGLRSNTGEKNAFSIMNDNLVIEIRDIFDNQTPTIASLARKYKCSESCIRGIVHRKTWIHL